MVKFICVGVRMWVVQNNKDKGIVVRLAGRIMFSVNSLLCFGIFQTFFIDEHCPQMFVWLVISECLVQLECEKSISDKPVGAGWYGNLLDSATKPTFIIVSKIVHGGGGVYISK